MCAQPSIAVFVSCGILFLPGISWRSFPRLLLVAPRAPVTIGATLDLMFHILCISNLRSWYVSIFSLSFSTICVSFYIATSIMRPSFGCLSITNMSGLRACICLSVLSSKSNSQGILWYEMEYRMKEKVGMEYGMAQVWNGMEDLMYGMEQIFQIPCKFHTCTF